MIGGVKDDVSSQTADDAPCHRESDASAVVIFIELHKLFEDVFRLMGWHTDTRVFNDEVNCIQLLADNQPDFIFISRVALGIWLVQELLGIVEQECESPCCKAQVRMQQDVCGTGAVELLEMDVR